jgi:periplasmic protein TonB
MPGTNPRVRRAVRSFLTLVAFAAIPKIAFAQGGTVYAGTDLDTPPKLVSASNAARAVQDAYPDQLKKAGIGGTVQVQFVVDEKGKVEASSVEVIAASLPQLGEAAKQAVQGIEFKPGVAKGAPVRSRVLLPLVFKAR